MFNSNTRRVQQKKIDDKSVYVTLPSDETGLYPGNTVTYEVVGDGKIVLTKIDEKLQKEVGIISYINKLLRKFELHHRYQITVRQDSDEKTNLNVVQI